MNLKETTDLFHALSNQKLFDLVNTIQNPTKNIVNNKNSYIRALESELENFLRD